MTDSHEELELFRKALLEARLRKSQQMIDADTGEVTFTKKHLRKMQYIINSDRTPLRCTFHSRKKKRILAVLIAAAILLIGSIAVYANRDAIIRFTQKIFGNHTKVSYSIQDNDSYVPSRIEQEYTLTYVPEGYELMNSMSNLIFVWAEWKNETGDYLRFGQSVINGGIHGLDNESSISEQIQIGEFEVCSSHHISSVSTYIWTDGMYVYKIECHTDISLEELARIMSGISVRE